ncbi:MAG: carbohydrate kinase, partial [Clostridia bacterium]|nr:carbohydrate kinase [Clostridia bacterium]
MLNIYDSIEVNRKEYDLLTIGELLIDMISTEFSEQFDCDSYIRKFGGSPSNIAINTKKLGINSIP